jgi:signal transduction histidine kinase
MENWIIGTRFVVILYCILLYTTGEMKRIPLVVLSILLYICAGMLQHVFARALPKTVMLLVELAIIIVSAVFLNNLFIFLLPLCILELIYPVSRDFRLWIGAILVSAMFCPPGLIAGYALDSLMCLAVFVLAHNSYNTIAALKEENERLKEKNDSLYARINQGTEYENQVKYLSQLEERNSLAQKIHDKVGHSLAGSLIQLEAAAMILDSDREKARSILEGVIIHLKDGMESIRSALRNIKPVQEQLGINRLKVLLEEFSLNNPIKAGLSYKGKLEVITNSYWKIILDNVREALTNSLKYSHASRIIVGLEVLNKLVRVEIRDNGAGALAIKKGLGLIGMEERTESAGGKLVIDGSSGFSIIMLLPVSEVANGDQSADSR